MKSIVEEAVEKAADTFEEKIGISVPEKTKEEIANKIKLQTFADPTYDPTFKMLFNSEEHKDILISLLNNLLGFTGDKTITKVELNTNELPVISFFETKEKKEHNLKSGISSAVDVLCTTQSNQKIIVEMQRKHEEYYLPRTQEYMAKIMSSYVKEGEGSEYHNKVLDTYILTIGKENIFRGKYELTNQKLFEITVLPWVLETKQEVPGNKMHWKFFELTKFKEDKSYKTINKYSSLKEQWLEFFIECSKQKVEPDRNELIKKGYEIMKTAKWSDNQYINYALSEIKERYENLEREKLKENAFLEGKLEGFKEGELKGVEKGIQQEKAKFQVKSEIKQAKFGFNKLKVEPEKMVEELEFKFLKTEHVSYIKEHLGETESVIGDHLHLFDMDIEY